MRHVYREDSLNLQWKQCALYSDKTHHICFSRSSSLRHTFHDSILTRLITFATTDLLFPFHCSNVVTWSAPLYLASFECEHTHTYYPYAQPQSIPEVRVKRPTSGGPFAVSFKGFMYIGKSGTYTFCLNSTDGSTVIPKLSSWTFMYPNVMLTCPCSKYTNLSASHWRAVIPNSHHVL